MFLKCWRASLRRLRAQDPTSQVNNMARKHQSINESMYLKSLDLQAITQVFTAGWPRGGRQIVIFNILLYVLYYTSYDIRLYYNILYFFMNRAGTYHTCVPLRYGTTYCPLWLGTNGVIKQGRDRADPDTGPFGALHWLVFSCADVPIIHWRCQKWHTISFDPGLLGNTLELFWGLGRSK